MPQSKMKIQGLLFTNQTEGAINSRHYNIKLPFLSPDVIIIIFFGVLLNILNKNKKVNISMNLNVYLYIMQCSFKCKYKHLIHIETHQTYNLYFIPHMCLYIFLCLPEQWEMHQTNPIVSITTTLDASTLPLSCSPNPFCLSE